MPKRTPEKVINQIQELDSQGTWSVKEIAEKTRVSPSLVYACTTQKEKGYSSYSEYLLDRLKQRGFSSFGEYQKYLMSKRASEFAGGYQEDHAEKTGTIVYVPKKRHIKQKGGSMYKGPEDMAKTLGFGSLQKYNKYWENQRQQRPLNRSISNLVNEQLEVLGKHQYDLALALEITTGAVSRIASGKTLPRKSLQQKFFEALELPYKTLDEVPK